MCNTLLIIRILCSANRPLEYMNQSYLVVEVVHAMDGVVAGAVGVVFAAASGRGERKERMGMNGEEESGTWMRGRGCRRAN